MNKRILNIRLLFVFAIGLILGIVFFYATYFAEFHFIKILLLVLFTVFSLLIVTLIIISFSSGKAFFKFIYKHKKILLTFLISLFIGNAIFGAFTYFYKNYYKEYEGNYTVVGKISDGYKVTDSYTIIVLENVKLINDTEVINLKGKVSTVLYIGEDEAKNIAANKIVELSAEIEKLPYINVRFYFSNYTNNIIYTTANADSNYIFYNTKAEISEVIKEKFKDFDGIVYQVDKLMEEEKYFVVSINGVSETNVDFEDAIMKNFIEKSQSCFPEDDFVSMSSFENAVKSLEEGKENGDRWNLLSTQLGKMDIDYEQLVSGLRKYKRSYLKTYQKLMEEAYGVPISIYNNKFDEFIKESVEYIKSKGYNKVIYIFDEFSTYLESLVEDGRINKNLDKIQELAEACHFSRQNDTAFIASIHKSISILLKSTILEKEKLDKVVGRFNEIPIDFSEGNELIKNTINVNKGNYLFMMNQYDEARHLDNITDGELEYYYPVHPITIKYLNMLSKLYAQENRTLFRFLSDVVDKKIRVEDIILDGKLNIVTMDYLYDYFIEAAVQDNLSIISSANDALRFCKEEWQEKVIKSLIVSRIAVYEFQGSHDIEIGLSVENLSDYLLIDDKKILEDFLQSISSKTSVNIYYDKENDVYMFMENTTSKVNLEKEKREIAKTIIEYDEILNLLRTKGKNRDYYNIKVSISPIVDVTSVKREFQSQVFNNSNIMKMLVNKSNLSWSNDGNIVHLLPQYFEVDSIDVSSIEKYMKNYGDNIAIAVPKKYDFNRETIIEYAVYKKMLINEKYLKDEGTKQYLVNEKNKYEDLLTKKIDEYTDIKNFLFVFMVA